MSAESPPDPITQTQASVFAQLLATEHWSLLATRAMTWSEVMSRITIHFTVASASVVVLALVAQATGFGLPFQILSIGLASAVLLLGTLTSTRVYLATVEDHGLVVAMNRLRAAYLDIAPGIERFLTTSAHDDRQGVMQTVTLGFRRSRVTHVAGSTGVFLASVNTLVAGTLGALVTNAGVDSTALVVAVGTVVAFGYLGCFLAIGRRTFGALRTDSRFPTPR